MCNDPSGSTTIEIRAVGDVKLPVVPYGQVQWPVKPAGQHRPRGTVRRYLGDLPGEVGDQQPVADERAVVQTRTELGQQMWFAATRVDTQHLSAGHLSRHDIAPRVEFDRVWDTEIACDTLCFATIGVDAPDFVGAHHREVQETVRADFHRVGRGHVFQQYPRRPAGQVDFQQPPAFTTFTDEQPALVNGDAVGRRNIVAQHPGSAGGVEHADPTVHDLGRVQVATGVERDVVGCDDLVSLGADGSQLPGAGIQRTDLTAGHLRDIDATVGAGAQTVGAEQPAGSGHSLESPGFRDFDLTGPGNPGGIPRWLRADGHGVAEILPLLDGSARLAGRYQSQASPDNSRSCIASYLDSGVLRWE